MTPSPLQHFYKFTKYKPPCNIIIGNLQLSVLPTGVAELLFSPESPELFAIVFFKFK